MLNFNFIDWLSFKDIFPIADSGMSLAEYCAQYSDVQSNWIYTVAAIIGILILILKKNKKMVVVCFPYHLYGNVCFVCRNAYR